MTTDLTAFLAAHPFEPCYTIKLFGIVHYKTEADIAYMDSAYDDSHYLRDLVSPAL